MDQSRRNYWEKRHLFTSVKNMSLVTPSEWLASVVRQSFLGKYPVQAIPNGIDLDVFKPTPSDFREKYGIGDKRMVLAVANVWSKKKGFDDICSLAMKLDNDKYQIVMVGLTEEQLSSVPENVIAIKRTGSVKELAEIYSAADVFVNASYEETMGMVTAEALACGTPAVVYDQTAVPEVVDETCGIVVKAGDVDGLVRAVMCISRNEYTFAVEHAAQYGKDILYNMYICEYQKMSNNII